MAISIQTRQPVVEDTQVEDLPEFEEEKPPAGLPWVIAFLRWVEEMILALSGYALTFALALGIVDLLTDGDLSAQWRWVGLGYAWSMALGIGGQLLGSAVRSQRSFRLGKPLLGGGFLVLMLILAFVEYQGNTIYGYHKAFGVSTVDALAHLGIQQEHFIELRSLTAVGLVVLSGFLRYQPAKRKTVAQERAESERRKQIAQIQADEKAARIAAGVGLARSAAAAVRGNRGPLAE